MEGQGPVGWFPSFYKARIGMHCWVSKDPWVGKDRGMASLITWGPSLRGLQGKAPWGGSVCYASDAEGLQAAGQRPVGWQRALRL